MIEREYFRKGFERTRSEDLYPDPTRMVAVREVRMAGERDGDLDDAWWALENNDQPYDDSAATFAERMAASGFVQVWLPDLGIRVWRHQ